MLWALTADFQAGGCIYQKDYLYHSSVFPGFYGVAFLKEIWVDLGSMQVNLVALTNTGAADVDISFKVSQEDT